MTKSEEANQVLELTDVYEVAFLELQGVSPTKVMMHEGKVTFCFQSEETEAKLKEFYITNATVVGKDYMHKIQDVRSIVFGMRPRKKRQ